MEDDATVAKLMGDMLDVQFATGIRKSASDAALEAECHKTIARFVGNGRGATASDARPQEAEAHEQRLSLGLAQLKEEFHQLTIEVDRNKAGLALECLLNRLFELFGLQPRQPFRIEGEQIDGSFVLDGHVYLLESKWEQNRCPKQTCWF